MSTLKYNTWLNTDNTENYKCRAWVNFNGTGTVAIRASGNVSSITDLGLGAYRVNFTVAMSDTNYCACMSGGSVGGYGTVVYEGIAGVSPKRTTSNIELETASNNSSNLVDDNSIAVAIFR